VYDLVLVTGDDLATGALEHADTLVLPYGWMKKLSQRA
jgi:hypothetical protein